MCEAHYYVSTAPTPTTNRDVQLTPSAISPSAVRDCSADDDIRQRLPGREDLCLELSTSSRRPVTGATASVLPTRRRGFDF